MYITGDATTLKGELESRLLLPQLAKEAASRAYLFPPADINTNTISSGIATISSSSSGGSSGGSGGGGGSDTSIGPPQYSAILFGPPGDPPLIGVKNPSSHVKPI